MLLCSASGLNASVVSMYFARGEACDKRFACPVMICDGFVRSGI